MALYKSAQNLFDELSVELPEGQKEDKVVIYEQKPTEEEVLEVHEPDEKEEKKCVFIMPLIPGAPDEEQIELEVSENDEEKPKSKKEEKQKEDVLEVDDPWAWKTPAQFISWLQNMVNNVPKHTGKDMPGCERALAYLKRMINECSKAMQQDYKGEIDAATCSDALDKLYDGKNRLEDRIEQIHKTKYDRKKKGDAKVDLVKEAQKTIGVGGVVITVPLLISSLARSIINGTVSGGKDLEDLYYRQVKAHKLNISQQTELIQLLADMNMPLRRDFIYLPDDETGHEERGSLITNYQA